MLRTADKRVWLGQQLRDVDGVPSSVWRATCQQRIITPLHDEFAGSAIVRSAGADAASGAWLSANMAVALPFCISDDIVVTKLGWRNGSSAGSNHDIGIYTAAGAKIVSTGSTAGSGSSARQFVDITDQPLRRGHYYLVKAVDATTANRVRQWAGGPAQAVTCAFLGMLEMATAFPLGATLTLVTPTFAHRTPDIFFVANKANFA